MFNYNTLDNLENETPNDLMYYRGTWKVSESEVLSFCKRKAEEKLSKTRDIKRNKSWQE